MSTANEVLARKVLDEIWNGGNLDLIDELYAEDFVCHVEPDADWKGRAGVRDAVNLVRGMFSDFEERIEDVVVDGGRTFCAWMESRRKCPTNSAFRYGRR